MLQQIAKTARQALRQTDFLGRYGGEEFAMVLTDTITEGAIVTAERVRRSIEDIDFTSLSPGFKVTISIGIADWRHREDPALTFRRADQALNLAKGSGRNRCVVAPVAEFGPAASSPIARLQAV